MKAQIQFVHTSPNSDLESIVNEGLDKLKEKYDWIIQAKVILRRERNVHVQDRGCNIELSIPGKNIFQESWEASFERAISESFRKLKRQLRKEKSRLYPHLD